MTTIADRLRALSRRAPVFHTGGSTRLRRTKKYVATLELGGAVVQRVRHLGLRSVGRGFKSCSRQRCVTTLGKLFTPMCLCHQAV